MVRGTRRAGKSSAARRSKQDPFGDLRVLLAGWTPETGPEGFEGLVARALASLTGRTFRLARSGFQFGRDAGTADAPFAITMEAKRYTDTVPLEKLVGKASIAALGLAGHTDLWALVATVEVSEPVQKLLGKLLDLEGAALLTLDWADSRLPPLAVLVTAARADVLDWVEASKGRALRNELAPLLDEVAIHPDFEGSRDELLRELSPATTGMGAFQSTNVNWATERFASLQTAQREFGQYLAPLAVSDEHVIVREAFLDAIDRATVEARQKDGTIVALLGAEGTGKSWIAVRWWAAQTPRPILLLSVGRIGELLSAGEPALDMLARLAAMQTGRQDRETTERWRRKLDGWSTWSGDALRFVVLIDGLNETSGKPWTSILHALEPTVRKLGGIVMVTCRQGYWEREIADRLALVRAEPVEITGYDDVELDAQLHAHEIADTLSPDVRDFIRNPRVFGLAVKLLPELASAEELNVDRLLLEYWRARLRERGDFVGHGLDDFNKLLIRHAHDYLDRPGLAFDRDDWMTRSGAAQRRDGRDLRNDLTDIEDGRFFNSQGGSYRFQPEGLRFALGLLIADEVRAAAIAGEQDLSEKLERTIDAVRAFDEFADSLTSAIIVACCDPGYPDVGIAALAASWSDLQNDNHASRKAMAAYAAIRPEPFLDAFELRLQERDDPSFLKLLLSASEVPSAASAVRARLSKWLGSWSRNAPQWGNAEERAKRQTDWNARIDQGLATLKPGERRFFEAACPEAPGATRLARTAVLFMVHRPQAPLARGFIAFAFARTIARDHRSPIEELGWAVRLNRIDHETLAAAVREGIKPFLAAGASPTARSAGLLALRLLGTLEDATMAEEIDPREPSQSRQRADRFCESDPLDPASERPANIENAATRLAEIDPVGLWNHMSTAGDDSDFDTVLPGLARFDPEPLVAFLNAVAATASERTDLPLRQLSWRLPWINPLFEETAVVAIGDAIRQLADAPARATEGEHMFILGMLVEGVLPHLDAETQHSLLASLPESLPFYLRFATLAKTLPSKAAERRIDLALASGRPRIMERALIFMAARPPTVSPGLRTRVLDCIAHPDPEVASAAVELGTQLGDAELDTRILELALPSETDSSWRTAARRNAFAAAVIRLGRTDLADQIPPEHLDRVAACLPAVLPTFADEIEASLAALAQPTGVPSPPDAIVKLEIEDDALQYRFNIDDRGEPEPDNPIEKFKKMVSDKGDDAFDRRQDLLHDQFKTFREGVISKGVLAAIRRPPMFALGSLVEQMPDRVAKWLEMILAVKDEEILPQLYNLSLGLAEAYAIRDPALASRVFDHLWTVEPQVHILRGPARLPLKALALFGASPSPEIDALRTRIFREGANDHELELLVLAAEQAGGNAWLNNFVVFGANSSDPADQALSITVSALRPANEVSASILAREWGTGFLGNAANEGRSRYDRAQWAAYWFDLAAEAIAPHEAWRFNQLALKACDRRALLNLDPRLIEQGRVIGGDLMQQLQKRADKTSRKRAETLYGHRVPDPQLLFIARWRADEGPEDP